MDVSSYNHSEKLRIHRSAADLFAIVSDVTRVGDLSPVCQSATWDDPARAGKPGAWFTGHNVIGDFSWDTRCKVFVSEPPREFSFVNFGPEGDAELVRWGYALEEVDDGTDVTESWQVLPAYPDYLRAGDQNLDVKARIDGMAELAREGITATLANLKHVAET
jgi:Polyketide cyclase / dehydrase and lipid transport